MDVREFLIRLVRFVVLSLAGAQLACAGTRDPNTPDEKYVEFGKQFPGVVSLRARCKTPDAPDAKPVYQYGSAVVIRPHWVLTAAHVLTNTAQPTALKDGAEYPLATVFVHEDFHDDVVGYHDVALGYSPKDFALKFYTPLYRGTNELGQAATIAGYGLHGTFLTGATFSDGKKRAGHNKIEAYERGCLLCTPSRAGQGKFPLEFLIAPGDSGGGLFIGNKLAGINSFLMASDKNPDGTYTDDAAHTRISLYADWVESEIKKYEETLETTPAP